MINDIKNVYNPIVPFVDFAVKYVPLTALFMAVTKAMLPFSAVDLKTGHFLRYVNNISYRELLLFITVPILGAIALLCFKKYIGEKKAEILMQEIEQSPSEVNNHEKIKQIIALGTPTTLFKLAKQLKASDPTQSINVFLKSADLGNLDSMNALGKIVQKGTLSNKDMSLAFTWFERAAKQGHASAQSNLGRIFRKGTGISPDFKQAIDWYTKAAAQNDVDAQYWLGHIYEKGCEGVSPDFKQAIDWYTKAAAQGDKAAQLHLGYLYDSDREELKDLQKAIDWYTKAAEQNDVVAQFNLGLIFEEGRESVLQDLQKAIHWYTKAAEQRDEEAISRIKKINNLQSKSDVKP
jgi:tetratricopeptide (TPR) repeat protein